ncbi:ankyrin repeat domain-containing protein [Paenibacillus spongiae]|uniref:Ankyrin repeat domain-containing protein n=1 Tax=Paenibacillus spongiae TaxID=2909671 RepID=A0ABY5S6R2_9BACL|nr:ankyrin repeat domain-containing protein [Paenibacillus spongiae]UVI29404.1 ankyrin repeat domain-containing protein [Paenibacillus spongiae]
MNSTPAYETLDPLFRRAVSAIDAGDVSELERLLAKHPSLIRDRMEYGEGYFRNPYLLWFIAENPIRNDKLPLNIVQVTRSILQAAERERVDSLEYQLDYAISLVCSGRVTRECGVQNDLIDVLVDAGADPQGALIPALAHRELAAVERLLERGARVTLPVAVCTGRMDDVLRLGQVASAGERQVSLTAAALYGQAHSLALVIALGVDLNAYSPPGFHEHATALHHAVDSGSLDAVKVLVEAGADLGIRDRIYQGTPLGWSEHFQHEEIAAYLRVIGEQK